ncbi:MAG: hypothetical protein ACTS4T_00380 [Candidatus Hodgkinia cicadicola]
MTSALTFQMTFYHVSFTNFINSVWIDFNLALLSLKLMLPSICIMNQRGVTPL